MRKPLLRIILAILMLSIATVALATETVSEQNGNGQVDVRAKSVYINPENMYSKPVSDGNASITTTGGATISISANAALLDGLQLHVIEMVSSDHEAYSWISGIMNGLCDEFTAYDIFFTDIDGNRVAVTADVTVSITTPSGYSTVQVYHVIPDGTKETVVSTQSDGNTLFTATTFSYYVLANKAHGGGTTPTNPPTTVAPTNPPVTPPTGDANYVLLWTALLFVSCSAIVTIIISKKRID